MASKPGPIPAGGKGEIKVVVNTDYHGGETLRKSFTVYSNDPKRSKYRLTVTGKVRAFADIRPRTVRLIGRVDQPQRAKVRILPVKDFKFKIRKIELKNGHDVDVVLKPLGSNHQGGYQLTVTSKKTDPGSLRDTLKIYTDNPAKPMFEIQVSGYLRAAPKKKQS